MATNLGSGPQAGSFLLELLYFAGWKLQVKTGRPARIHASRGSVELDVTGASVPEVTGTVFAQAMRSGGGRQRTEGE